MSTREERADEARQEARENRDCIGCALGITHDHQDDDDEDECPGCPFKGCPDCQYQGGK